MKDKRQTVALIVDGTKGHHLAFLVLFTESLIRLNKTVLVIAPKTDFFKEKLNEKVILIEKSPLSNKRPTSNVGIVIDKLQLWNSVSSQLLKAERDFRLKIEMVFFTWLDYYLANFLPYPLLPVIFRFKWAGLYFHPNHVRLFDYKRIAISSIDSAFLASNCKGVALHDMLVVNSYRSMGINSVFFPEICDMTSPSFSNKYFMKIKSQANSRFTFGVVGPEKRKNALLLVRAAKVYEHDNRFFFVFAGLWNLEGYTAEEKRELETFKSNPTENTLFLDEYIEEGVPVNSLLNALDIIFITYKDFYSTSNYTTKAAFLRKIVISNNNFVIGEETNEFKLGVVIADNSVEEISRAILEVYQNHDELLKNAQFDSYLSKHSLPMLDKAFTELLLE